MNYQIIKDEAALQEFVEWLPECKENEQYYMALFARKKYLPNSFLTADKCQIKRVTATKDRIIEKLRQWECAIGSYRFRDNPIPQEALAVYITPNPRCFRKAGLNLLKEIADKTIKNEGYNPRSLAMNVIQTSCSNKYFFDVDVDWKTEPCQVEERQIINRVQNFIGIKPTGIITKGGMHVLIPLADINPQHKKSWYNNIANSYNSHFNVTMNGDNMIPVPGCTQGGFIPKFIK